MKLHFKRAGFQLGVYAFRPLYSWEIKDRIETNCIVSTNGS